MTDARVSRRYARALFQAAKKLDIVESVEADLNLVGIVISQSSGFKNLLKNPAASKETKLGIISNAFSDRVTALTMQFIRLLLEKGREENLELVRISFEELRRADQGVIKAIVTTTIELTEAEKRKLIDKLTRASGKTIEAEFDTNSELIGGIKVAYENYVLDGSVSGAIGRLKDTLIYDVLKQN